MADIFPITETEESSDIESSMVFEAEDMDEGAGNERNTYNVSFNQMPGNEFNSERTSQQVYYPLLPTPTTQDSPTGTWAQLLLTTGFFPLLGFEQLNNDQRGELQITNDALAIKEVLFGL